MSVAKWCFILLLIAATPAIAADQEIVRYSGQGHTVTRPFVTDGPWEAQFEAPDALFIYLLGPDGNAIDLVANQATSGRGSYYSSRMGADSDDVARSFRDHVARCSDMMSPELNPVENIWQFMRDNWLSNRVFQSYDDIIEHCCYAWNKLVDQPWTIMSIGMRDWAHRF